MNGRICGLAVAAAFLLAACAGRPRTAAGDVSVLLRSERDFAELAAQEGTRDAFLAYLAEGSILFNPGPADARAFYRDRPRRTSLLSWRPVFAEMAAACDLGYTTGPWELRTNGPGGEPAACGEYVSIWKKLPDGAWKLALDTGVQHAKPPAPQTPMAAPLPESACLDHPPSLDPRVQADALIRQEAAFSELSAEKGAWEAYRRFAAADVRLYREEAFPAIGLEAALRVMGRTEGKLAWKVSGAAVSASGDLGYTYGIAQLERGQGRPPETSAYVRIWRLSGKGGWKAVLDLATPIPPPGKP